MQNFRAPTVAFFMGVRLPNNWIFLFRLPFLSVSSTHNMSAVPNQAGSWSTLPNPLSDEM